MAMLINISYEREGNECVERAIHLCQFVNYTTSAIHGEAKESLSLTLTFFHDSHPPSTTSTFSDNPFCHFFFANNLKMENSHKNYSFCVSSPYNGRAKNEKKRIQCERNTLVGKAS